MEKVRSKEKGCSRIVPLRFQRHLNTLVSQQELHFSIYLLLILYPNFHFFVKFLFFLNSDVTDRTQLHDRTIHFAN